MASNNKALGRGLDALLPDKESSYANSQETDTAAKRELRVDQIRRNPDQPRRAFGD